MYFISRASQVSALARPESRVSIALCAAPAAMTRTAACRSASIGCGKGRHRPAFGIDREIGGKQRRQRDRARHEQARTPAAARRRSEAATARRCRSRRHGARPLRSALPNEAVAQRYGQQGPQEQHARDRKRDGEERRRQRPTARSLASGKGTAPRKRSAGKYRRAPDRRSTRWRASRTPSSSGTRSSMVKMCRMRILPPSPRQWASPACARNINHLLRLMATAGAPRATSQDRAYR